MELAREVTKRWQLANKDKMKEYSKRWRETHPHQAKQQPKEWQENNRDRAIEHRRKYNNTYIDCECGCNIRKGSLALHRRSQKHIKLLEQI